MNTELMAAREELSALRAECERLREALESAANNLKVIADHIDARAYPDLVDRAAESWDKCRAALGEEVRDGH
jgi:hypothetical protein